MNDFVYYNNTKLIYGKGVENQIGDNIKQLGFKNILIVYGQNSVVQSGLLDRVKSSLSASGLKFVEFGGVVANPTKTHMLQGVEISRQQKVDFVLGVGGGSVLDEAKAIAIGAVNDDVWSFFERENKPKLNKCLPIGAMLTLPATGSENSTATVIRDEKTGFKASFGHDLMRPVLAFVNPQLMFTLPKVQIANGASDMLAHMMERYFSPQTDVVATDYLLKAGMQAVFEIAPKLYRDNHNYQLWNEFCLLGTVAHNGMLSLGRTEQDWGTHNIENLYLSGTHNIAHGTGLAITFTAWLKYMSNKRPNKILQFAKEVMGATGNTDREIMDSGIANLVSFYKSIDLPISMADVGIDYKQVNSQVNNHYNSQSRVGAYGQLNDADIKAIFELAK
ncbi:MAG: iron-containing alcohol dehydrogenase [Firmicutes bacterium]|nr:iron-containing alcohol dehydrogenase [Bacillota bacterium]MCL1953625.1 iron-containing alcohol dehydrogenase [Bacillota bacterium]